MALIGAPGSGKSTLGPLLAERLGGPFVDVDTVIEQRQGRAIRDIFADDGEDAFRAIEAAVTVELLAQPGVVSLGGGAPLTPRIATALGDVATVWLQ
ncbi:MAG: shikimate kinase, partial [Propioniciclava sp.]